ncbi:hypothetical protein QN277_019381 [Acacia crassicarpa]|uniref:Protein ENDOSPERM DEFECTIVE 1 n=2 Tax=Acacia crassicarpa TaxID=499986 RepID=A0AAE1MQX0_9FABA|nr:hypothetical protein QN277_019381 [Acacia crassicarpa]
MIQEHKHIKVTEKSNSAMEMVTDAPAPPPPPLPPPPPSPSHQRRPRVREVSSRFMSPVVSSVQRRPRQQQSEADPLGTADENRPAENSETPLPFGSQCKSNVVNTTATIQRKQRAVKPFKENGGGGRVEQQPPHPSKSCSGRIGNGFTSPSLRPDTPTVTVSSRYRLTPHQRSVSMNATVAAKLLQASGISSGSQSSTANSLKGNVGSPQRETNSMSGDTSSVCSDDENHSNSEVNCSIQSLPEFRSSVLEGDTLPTVSTRSVDEKTGNKGAVRGSGDSLKFPTTPFSRSLNMSSSGSEHLLNHSIRGSEKHVTSLVKQYTNSAKVGGLCLPPVAPCPKPVIDTKKGKKGSGHQEDVHSLRLLYNRYLQWRYANAKTESSMKAQQRDSEKELYSLALKMSEFRDSVNLKRSEVQLLKRAKTLLTILEAQIPYVEEWSNLEEEYSVSLTETTEALLNASVQLPVGGNVKVDAREVGEAINSSMKMMESIVFHVQRFMSKVEETDISISELARVVGGERAFIGECGSLLARAYKSQVEECSLRSQLMQIHSIGHKAKTVEL